MKTAQKNSIFSLNNLDLVQFWMNEIHESKKFYNWLQGIINERYSHQQCNIYECSGDGDASEYINKADELINMILNMTVPEVDMD